MKEVTITEVSIDSSGRIRVKPKRGSFPFIYRAGMEVSWDEANKALLGGIPREWPPQRWFEQIIAAVSGEYNVRLKLAPNTVWSDVPLEVQRAIIDAHIN